MQHYKRFTLKDPFLDDLFVKAPNPEDPCENDLLARDSCKRTTCNRCILKDTLVKDLLQRERKSKVSWNKSVTDQSAEADSMGCHPNPKKSALAQSISLIQIKKKLQT